MPFRIDGQHFTTDLWLIWNSRLRNILSILIRRNSLCNMHLHSLWIIYSRNSNLCYRIQCFFLKIFYHRVFYFITNQKKIYKNKQSNMKNEYTNILIFQVQLFVLINYTINVCLLNSDFHFGIWYTFSPNRQHSNY